MAQVLMPNRQRSQADALAQVLNIAGSVFNIKEAYESSQRNAQLFEQQQAEQSALSRGELTPMAKQSLLLKGLTLQQANQSDPSALKQVTEQGPNYVRISQQPKEGNLNRERFEFAKSEKAEEKLDKGVRRIADNFEKTGVIDLLPILERVDQQLVDLDINKGIDVENLDKDVPGFGATGFLPDILTFKESQNLRQDVNAAVNLLLKARSGGAVTPQEASRLASELKGANTDRALLVGLRNLRNALKSGISNVIASVPPDSAKLYNERNSGVFNSPIFTGERKKSEPINQVSEQKRERQSSGFATTNFNAINDIINKKTATGSISNKGN